MEVRFYSSTSDVNQQARPEHLCDGHCLARQPRPRTHVHQGQGQRVQHAGQDEGEPDVRVDASRLTFPAEGRCRDRKHHGQEPLGEEQPEEHLIRLKVNGVEVLDEDGFGVVGFQS